jgi:hypothetical protein
MTEPARRKRRRAAPAGRILIGGLAVSATGILMAGMALDAGNAAGQPSVEAAVETTVPVEVPPVGQPAAAAPPPTVIVRRHIVVTEGGAATPGRAAGDAPAPQGTATRSGGQAVQANQAPASPAPAPQAATPAPAPAPKPAPVTKSRAS